MTVRFSRWRGGRLKRHIETRDRPKQLRVALTEPERRLWYRLRANRLGVKFQRQVVIAPFVADFAARTERLVVEVDGDTHSDRHAYDAARSAELERQGYKVIRFTNSDVMSHLDAVLSEISRALGRGPDDPLSPTIPR